MINLRSLKLILRLAFWAKFCDFFCAGTFWLFFGSKCEASSSQLLFARKRPGKMPLKLDASLSSRAKNSKNYQVTLYNFLTKNKIRHFSAKIFGSKFRQVRPKYRNKISAEKIPEFFPVIFSKNWKKDPIPNESVRTDFWSFFGSKTHFPPLLLTF